MVAPVTLLRRVRRGLWKVRTEPYEWLVLVGDRLVLAGVLVAAFALVVLGLMVTGTIAVRNTAGMIYLFQAFIGGNLTLITIVLSINQLVLSREFKTPGELREQMRNVISYREHVAETTGEDVIPVTPAAFLLTLLDGTRINAQRVGGAVSGIDHDRLPVEVDELVTELSADTAAIGELLEESQDGIFSALAVTLETNYSHQLNEVHRIRTVYDDALPAEAHDALNELGESLKQVDVARQYFKSIYMQSELARLSQILLYVGLPAVASAVCMFLIYTGGSQSAIPSSSLPAVVLAVVALGFSPLAVLFSFVLRVAKVAERTVAITPFTIPTQEVDGVDRDAQ